jgi:hypothetical protein
MSDTPGVPAWLRVGLLLGFPMALGVSASFAIGVHLQEGCRGTALTQVVGGVGFAIVVIGAVGAGWWASQGVREGSGCLAGLVAGVLVAAAVIVAGLLELAPQASCGAAHLPEYLRPQATSFVIQTVVSSALGLAGLVGVLSLLAARVRKTTGRASRRNPPEADTTK